jgi:hypothetical protein
MSTFARILFLLKRGVSVVFSTHAPARRCMRIMATFRRPLPLTMGTDCPCYGVDGAHFGIDVPMHLPIDFLSAFVSILAWPPQTREEESAWQLCRRCIAFSFYWCGIRIYWEWKWSSDSSTPTSIYIAILVTDSALPLYCPHCTLITHGLPLESDTWSDACVADAEANLVAFNRWLGSGWYALELDTPVTRWQKYYFCPAGALKHIGDTFFRYCFFRDAKHNYEVAGLHLSCNLLT